jgi:hypothetical protein
MQMLKKNDKLCLREMILVFTVLFLLKLKVSSSYDDHRSKHKSRTYQKLILWSSANLSISIKIDKTRQFPLSPFDGFSLVGEYSFKRNNFSTSILYSR